MVRDLAMGHNSHVSLGGAILLQAREGEGSALAHVQVTSHSQIQGSRAWLEKLPDGKNLQTAHKPLKSFSDKQKKDGLPTQMTVLEKIRVIQQ